MAKKSRDDFYSFVMDLGVGDSQDYNLNFLLKLKESERLETCIVPVEFPNYHCFTTSDNLLKSESWHASCIARVSRPTDQTEGSPSEMHKQWDKEIEFCNYTSILNVMFPVLTRTNVLPFAKLINRYMSQFPKLRPILQVALADTEDSSSSDDHGWDLWNTARRLCGSPERLTCCLHISEDLPTETILQKWLCEPLSLALVSHKLFITELKGGVCLTLPHQRFVQQLMARHVKIQLTVELDTNTLLLHKMGKGKDAPRLYRNYRQYLVGLFSAIPLYSNLEELMVPYFDKLQLPLQPLQDNLPSQTYEVFELDPVKYDNYSKSVEWAIKDTSHIHNGHVVIMVVGAGRGPLVRASLEAVKRANVTAKVYAVEKNPNAVIHMNYIKSRDKEWDTVEIITTDMRYWQSDVKGDIVVSELLGSFSDNELSPECLDGVHRHLKPTSISIPYLYTSYLAPIQSTKLHYEVRSLDNESKFESSYVVHAHHVFPIAEPQSCFTFSHPNEAFANKSHAEVDEMCTSNSHNKREITLQFTAECNSLIHGFIGYFTAWLYKDITISIHPDMFSTGMISWFPIYFPIRNPMLCRGGDVVTIDVARLTGKNKVWYEWAVVSPETTHIHNINGRGHAIGF